MEIKTYGWEETPGEIRHRIQDPKDFQPDSFRRKTINSGVSLVLGKLLPDKVPAGGNPDAMVTQAVRFQKKTDERPDGWTLDTAKAWVEEHFTAVVNHERLQGTLENMVDGETIAQDLMPGEGAPMDERRKSQRARADRFGIEIDAKNSALTAPAGWPTDPEAYADPVNFGYRIDDLAHANDSRAKFRQHYGAYQRVESQRAIYSRIVEAQIKHGGRPSYSDADHLDKLLPSELVAKIKAHVQEHAARTQGVLRKLSEATEGPPKLIALVASFFDLLLSKEQLDIDELNTLNQALSSLWCPWKSQLMGESEGTEQGAVDAMSVLEELARAHKGSLLDFLVTGMPSQAFVAEFREIADLGKAETYQLKGIEIFAVGEWNGDRYTIADLDEMVKNFDALKGEVKPPLRLGHKEQLAKADKNNTGMPAFGWVTGLKRDGEKLVADFSFVPRVIKDLVEKRAFARVSAEISPEYYATNDKGEEPVQYGKVLRGVALLGGDIPAVTTLKDVAALYRAEGLPLGAARTVSYEIEVHSTQTTTGGQPMPENPKPGNPPTTGEDPRVAEFAEKEKAFAAFREQALADQRKLRAQLRDQDIDTFTDALRREGKLLPAKLEQAKAQLRMAYNHEELLGDNLVQFTAANGGKGPVAVAKEVLSSQPKAVDLGEIMPQPRATTEGTTPGAPATMPLSQYTEDPSTKVLYYTNKQTGVREPVMNADLDADAHRLMAADKTLTYAEALIRIDRARQARLGR